MSHLKKSLGWLVNHPVLALVILLALTILLRLFWGWQVDHQLNRRIAQIRARQQPVNFSEVTYPRIPASENAWALQIRAFAALAVGINSPSNQEPEMDVYPLTDANWMAAAEKSETAHAPAFALARAARAKTSVVIRNSLPPPVMNTRLGYMNDVKTIACTLIDGAIHAHLKHNDAEAIERLLDALHIARSMHHDDFIPCHMLANGLDTRLCVAARIIFSDPQPKNVSTVPANMSQLIAQLQDEQLTHEGLARGIIFERLLWTEFYADRASENWLLRPLAGRELIRAHENSELLWQAAQYPTYPQAQRLLQRFSTESPRVQGGSFGRQHIDRHIPRFSRWFHQHQNSKMTIWLHFRSLAERRSTVVALAAQRYRLEQGRWPTKLDELVPAYLTALPADPFTEDGRPIGYLIAKLPDGKPRPLLFFEAGRTDAPIPNQPRYRWYGQNDSETRQYRDLSYFDASLLEKAVDHDPGKANAPGNQPQ
jgi:hypothetical protein